MRTSKKKYGPLHILYITVLFTALSSMAWLMIIQPMRYAGHGVNYSGAATFRSASVVRHEMMRRIPRVFLQIRGLDIVLQPDDRRKNIQLTSPGWAIALDGFREVARCRYEPVWSGFLSFRPVGATISDCTVS